MANAGESTERNLEPSSVKRVRRFASAYRGRCRYAVKLDSFMSSRIEKFERAERRIWEAVHRNQEGFKEYMENNLTLKKLRRQRQVTVTAALRQVLKAENKCGRDRYYALRRFRRLVRTTEESDTVYFSDLPMDAGDLGIDIVGSGKAAQARSLGGMDPGGRFVGAVGMEAAA
ncbi:hypothetical protein BHE90_017407 [Fusarium euwallaceae]|uniref:Uncharacterized protein n=1 Tax=Fusarium euwallaceae TaxID=1147111 RepID=A0A430KXM4_9HYPO|nr:hypothetical protein BHE90_017407 [Fusarium euwallaceae]